MSISLDYKMAEAILFEEATAARAGTATPTVKAWQDRVDVLGTLCPHRKSSTTIAILGTAILAKATDDRVEVYSLLDRDDRPNAYSARTLVDVVWARQRAALGIDLGANGTNPMNNTPFIGKTRIEDISGVKNVKGWAWFMDCMSALKALPSSAEARQALRGFILARSRSVLATLVLEPGVGDHLTPNVLVAIFDKFVAEKSEGGRRAQACAAGILDAAFGDARVVVKGINDPDRVAPLDVSIRDDEEPERFSLALEVKDKPIKDYSIIASIEKTVKDHGVRNMGVLAVAKDQEQKDFDSVSKWAVERGVKVTVFLTWKSFYLACRCFAEPSDLLFEGAAFRQMLQRGAEIGVQRDGLEQLMKSV